MKLGASCSAAVRRAAGRFILIVLASSRTRSRSLLLFSLDSSFVYRPYLYAVAVPFVIAHNQMGAGMGLGINNL